MTTEEKNIPGRSADGQDHERAIKIIECPRDAMQGWPRFIPTENKIEYLNTLLQVGFNTLDFGSFVSPKSIPQMADTKEVLKGLDLNSSSADLLAIVANVRGAEEAVQYKDIAFLGFPLSVSETFQLRNTRKTIVQSLNAIEDILWLCKANNKELVIYISMGFGNPYGDVYHKDVVISMVEKITEMGIRIISIADTVGIATPDTIACLFSHLTPAFPMIELGAHFHSTSQSWREKIDAAYQNGCRRFDSAINGIGGCPMAEDKLVGNIATENLLLYCRENDIPHSLNIPAFNEALLKASEIFN